MLYYITEIVNFAGLALAIWLGIYLVTHSPRSLIAWLTGLTLWSVAGLFLNILLALHPPPAPEDTPRWIFLLFPFWRPDALELGWPEWLQGWLVVPAIAFWHHVTVLMRPGRINSWRLARVLLGYGLCLVAIYTSVNTSLMFSSVSGDPLYLTTIKPGPLYPYFLILLLAFLCMCLINLNRSARLASNVILRQQLMILVAGTLTAGLIVPVSFASYIFHGAFPRVIDSVILTCAIALIGYGVANYRAIVEGRSIHRDFAYNALLIGAILALYMVITWFSVRVFKIPTVAFIFVLTLVIITHSLVDVARHSLDVFFYRHDLIGLRANLRSLTRLVGEKTGLIESLNLILDSLCDSVSATFGILFIIEDREVQPAATYQWKHTLQPISHEELIADDILPLQSGHFPPPLAEAILLVPLYAENVQLGALILGGPKNSLVYSDGELELILSTSDQLAEVVQQSRREGEFHQQVAHLVQSYSRPPAARLQVISVEVLEKSMRNLHDYAYLGTSPLADLKLVGAHLPREAVTHIDRGKAVHDLIINVLNKLRPESKEPGSPPPREWYPYLILHDAYLIGLSNSEIMSRLYISEGTFNRTRRAAICSTALAINEMETALS